ncbi:MAG: MarR family transcriptional regulator [Candidatus Bathyarchaeota archaeon]|nr:MAG: MarR family transcriptional regulator [Candidatus Bathyarchaeota archaeon]
MPRRKINVKKEVLMALSNKKRLTWSELLEETGISKGALSTFLTKMIKCGIVETEADISKRPPSTIYQLSGTKIGQALDFVLLPIEEKLSDFKRLLDDIKGLDEMRRQEEFKKIFWFIALNLLADHLSCFEAALAVHRRAKSKEEAIDFYFQFWHTSFGQTAKAIFELLLSEPEYELPFNNSVDEVIWIVEKIRPKRKETYDINQALKELAVKLNVKET